MKKLALLWPAAVGVVLSLVAVGCAGDAPPSASSDELNVSFVVSSLSSLPTCTSALSGTVAFVSSTPPAVSVCNGTAWSTVACGQSNAGQVLFASTTQSVLAACVHSAWTQVTLPAGPTGATGATGATGNTGATGAAGSKSLVTTAAEPRGANCFDGGKKVTSGVDTNNNGTLDAAEVQSTSYVCNSAGQPVTSGINGQPALEITEGGGHTCALLADGSVWCWGVNYQGQLGNNTFATDPSLAPVPVAAVSGSGSLTGVSHISAGTDTTCAVLSGGTVVCWGGNYYGQLATATTGPSTCNGSPCSVRPIAVAGLSGVTAIAGGGEHFCAVTGGAIKCWGVNQYGQLGNGNSTGSNVCNGYPCNLTPASVVGTNGTGTLTNVASISSSSWAYHTCAVLTSGAVDCWGLNFFGQLGNGSFEGPDDCQGYGCATKPKAVPGVTASAVVVGSYDTCAIDSSNRSLQCWGDNSYGQLGVDGGFGPSLCLYGEPCAMSPVTIPNLLGVTKAAVGGSSVCAAVTGGRALCIGSNIYGQLGDGTTSGSYSPVEVVGLQDVEAISLGGGQTACAIESGLVECWGANYDGQAGNRSETETHYPVAVQ